MDRQLKFEPNDKTKAMIVEVSKRTGLREPVVYELFERGWTFTETLNGDLSWHISGHERFAMLDLRPIKN